MRTKQADSTELEYEEILWKISELESKEELLQKEIRLYYSKRDTLERALYKDFQ